MAFLRLRHVLPLLALGLAAATAPRAQAPAREYAGSEACRRCHPKIYAQWRLTPHARMLVDARRDPSAILATDFNPSIPFRKSDIDFTVGSHWVQKYLTRIDGVLYVLPKYWNVPERRWEAHTVANWREQPYDRFCDGCHTVGFDVASRSFFEPGVGCEACHGPGLRHVEEGGKASAIVNPARLPHDRAQMVCMACHTDGKDKATETVPFPTGSTPGKDLSAYFTDFFMPKPKSYAWYRGTMDFLERRRMFYFYQSNFYSTNRACDVCGFDRGASHQAERFMGRNEYCGTCHERRYENFLQHSGHRPETTECTDCHVPQMAQPGKRYSIHDHKFDFSQPAPACTECHPAKEVAGKRECRFRPKGFRLRPVKLPRQLTLWEACVHCHKGKSQTWAREVAPRLVDRFVSGKAGAAD
ncbi:MAG: hypothetical protein HY900_35255 [Deltaproteobacteria bacterium]|nr:hypothetical protein [Deltaproteobacteria bacterium]